MSKSRGELEIQPAPLAKQFIEPAPVIIGGLAIWVIATVVTVLLRSQFGDAWKICLVGIGVGIFGCAVVYAQRRAVRRGSKSAQTGLSQ